MLNKFNAALLATVIFGILFPLSYHCMTGAHLAPVAVAISAVIFFLLMLAVFGRILRNPSLQQR